MKLSVKSIFLELTHEEWEVLAMEWAFVARSYNSTDDKHPVMSVWNKIEAINKRLERVSQ